MVYKIPPEHKRLFKETWMPMLGAMISFFEFILTSVYQFYFLGFGLSLSMWIGSMVYLYLKWQDYKIWLKSKEETQDYNERSVNLIMNAQQKVEEKQKISRWQKVLVCCYMFLLVGEIFMFGARFCSMVAHR